MPLQFVNGMLIDVPALPARDPTTAFVNGQRVSLTAAPTGVIKYVKQSPAAYEEYAALKSGGNGMATPVGYAPGGRFVEPTWSGQPNVVTTLGPGGIQPTGTPVPSNGVAPTNGGGFLQNLGIPAAIAAPLAAVGLPVTIAGLLALVGSRVKFPWQTPEGEGFIAPWTQQAQTPTGLWGQEGVQYAGGAVVPAGGFGAAGFGQAPMQAWNNAAKDGSTPATAEYIRLGKRSIAVRSLKTGVISKYRLPYTIGIHTNMSMGKFLKADVMLDRFTRRLAKRSKRLKLQ